MKKAFTLVELLVTIVLFSLLLVTALYSFRFVSLNIRNINNTNPTEAINYNLLRDAISSIYYYVEFDGSRKILDGQYYHFFKGTRSECFFTSKSPIFNKEISMIHLKYQDGNLSYQEGKIFGKSINFMKLDKISLNKKITLSKNLKSAYFSYTFAENIYNELVDNIPSTIKVNIEDNRGKTRVYIFSTKADNEQHLNMVTTDGES